MKNKIFSILPMLLICACLLFAGCQQKLINITFYLNNGYDPIVYSIKENTNTGLPEMKYITAPKPYLEFKNWCTDAELKNEFNIQQKLLEDTSLYAQWDFKDDYSAIRLLSNSMKPEFSKGDTLILQSVMMSEIKIGDVIAFYYCPDDIPNYNGTAETANDFKTGQETFKTAIFFHKVYKIRYDSNGDTWFYTYGTNNLKSANSDPDSEDIEANYRVDRATRADHVIGKYVETFNDLRKCVNTDSYLSGENLSGNVTFVSSDSIYFTATDVDCVITGLITGVENPPSLDILTFSATNTPTEESLASWQSNHLQFSEGKSIGYTITIQNCSKERTMKVLLKDTHLYNDIVESIAFDNQEYILETEVEIKAGEVKSFVINMSLNSEPTLTTYGFDLKLQDSNNL